VITASYNRASVIGEALASVAGQTYAAVEHVVVDGGSTDGTLDVVRRLGIPGLKVVSEPDDGIYDALNKGIRLTCGDVVGLVHSDDLLASDTVLERVALAFEDPSVDLVYGDLDYVAPSDPERVIRHWIAGPFSRIKLRRGWMPPHPTVFVRRRVFDRLGAYDTSYRIAADYEALLRFLSTDDLGVAYIPDVLVKMRMGGASNGSLRRIIRKSREDYRALRSTGVGGLAALAWKNLSKIPQFVVKPS
jgi:glycosyltransferase